jgi:transposase InsO family protein
VLRENRQVTERRRQARHPARKRPELMATGPGQVFTWDITKLAGPARGLYYDAYVMIDIFSRYIVGWKVAATESAELAEGFIADVFTVHGVPQVVHADRGTSMTSKKVADLLADLHVVRSHSRPHVSNDNPFSEAAFKTVKYHPSFPQRFGSIQDARAFCESSFTWYNHEHHHSGVGLHTPCACRKRHPPWSVRFPGIMDLDQLGSAVTVLWVAGDVCGMMARRVATTGVPGCHEHARARSAAADE